MKAFKSSSIKFLIEKAFRSNYFSLAKRPMCLISDVKPQNTEINTPENTSAKNPDEKPVEPMENQKKVKKSKQIKINQFAMSPHSYWLTQGKGMERPYTGDYWFTKDVGHYECHTCSKKLFLSEYKYFPPTGMASFWTSLPNAIESLQDAESVKENFDNIVDLKSIEHSQKQRCVCSQCKSHLGLIYMDGPPPTFLRFSINSGIDYKNLKFCLCYVKGSLKFVEKQWFENPLRIRERRKAKRDKKDKNRKIVKIPDFEFDKKKYYDVIMEKKK